MSDDATPETRELPIDETVIDRVAEENGVDADDLADELVVLDAALIGKHSEYEAEREYVTVGGRRAYRVDADEWDALTAELDDELATPVATAHTEQARLLADEAVSDVRFDGEHAGVVIGVDTAEEMT